MAANMPELKKILTDFADHIGRVNEMPMYYGDATLQELLRHSQSIAADVIAFAEEFLVQPVTIDGKPIKAKKDDTAHDTNPSTEE